MKKLLTTIGCLAFATSLAFAQSGSGPNNTGAAGNGAQTYPGHDPAFHASGGTGHGVGINGGTHTGTVIGSPYGAAGTQNTNRARSARSQTNSHSLHARPPAHSP
jgi:hypothetical protein